MEKTRNAKGEGSFTTNPDGSITHRKSVGYKSNGRRKVLTVTAATKAACIREMRKKEDTWNKKRMALHIQSKSTVVELCQKHLDYQVENEELKRKSIDRRECTITNQIGKYDIGTMQIQMLTSADVDRHIQGLIREGKLSESSITKALDVLNAAFEWAILQGDLEKNPAKPVKDKLMKKLKKMSEKKAGDADVAVLSDEEMEAFVQEALKINRKGKRVYPAGDYMLLLLYTGMRCGEMIALRWRDVDWENGILTIEKSASMAKNRDKKGEEDNNYVMHEDTTKNQKARNIELTEDAKQVLRSLYCRAKSHHADDLITPTLSGKMNTPSNLEHRQKVIFKNGGLGGLEGGLHIFRKTFATRMYESGARVEEIAAYIGDLESTTRKYYIAIRKKIISGGVSKQIVRLPGTGTKEGEEKIS